MRRMRTIAAGAACLFVLNLPALAHERCGCREGGGEVLNGRLNTADFDGGVGDRFGSGSSGGVIVYSGASSGAFSGASASATAHASASARASVSTHFGGRGHGGGMHGGSGGHH